MTWEGFVPPDYLPSFYQRADVFVSPSTVNESFGITLLEAMSAGAPAVATSVNGTTTLGEDGVTGLIVPPKDEPAMAAAIQRLLEDRPARDAPCGSGAGARQALRLGQRGERPAGLLRGAGRQGALAAESSVRSYLTITPFPRLSLRGHRVSEAAATFDVPSGTASGNSRNVGVYGVCRLETRSFA